MKKETLTQAVKAVAKYAKEIDEWYWNVSLVYKHEKMNGEGVYFFRSYVSGSTYVEAETIAEIIEKLKAAYNKTPEEKAAELTDLPF